MTEDAEPNFGTMTVECVNPGCENFEINIDVVVNLNAPHVICGPCGTVLSPADDGEVTPT